MGGFLSGRTSLTTVQTADIADNAITSAKILADAVTLAKMAAGTDGNVISFDASGDPVAIATGNDGQVLHSAGAGAQPAFETLSAGWELVESATPSSASSVTFSHTVESGYDYRIVMSNMTNAGDLSVVNGMKLQYGTGAGPTFQTSGYVGQHIHGVNTSLSTAVPESTDGCMFISANGYGNGATEQYWIEATIFNPGAAALTATLGRMWCINSDGNEQINFSTNMRSTADTVTALKLLVGTSSFSGNVSLSRNAVA